jgi:uncharacterized protein YdhG (YjbR/CyaY superfamily)
MHGNSDAATPEAYIEALDEPRRSDIRALHELIRETVPELEPTMEFKMLAYGTYHYRYASGREGDWALVSIASNKSAISLYVACAIEGQYAVERHAPHLGKASCGKSCVRFKRLADLNLDAVRELLRDAVEHGPMVTGGP